MFDRRTKLEKGRTMEANVPGPVDGGKLGEIGPRSIFIEKNVEHKQGNCGEGNSRLFSPNNPIIVICTSVTDRNM